MTKNANDRSQLLDRIFEIVKNRGLKASTMDFVAHQLGMSKRTLYEIFDSKVDMLIKVIDHLLAQHNSFIQECIATSPNVLVAFIRIFEVQAQFLTDTNVNFISDMDSLYPEIKERYRCQTQRQQEETIRLFERGAREGVFMEEFNYRLLHQTLKVQLESLKRMEEIFADELSLNEIYRIIGMTFLRSIASRKGLEMLEKYGDALPAANIKNK